METSVSENAHSDIIRICQDFLQNNETDETLASILDMDTPDVQEMKNPPSENIYAALAEEPGTGPYYAVTFSTTEDSMLGPIILYVNQEKSFTVPGIGNECPIDRVVQKGAGSMSNEVFTIDRIKEIVKPIALKYHAEEIYLFGSYARNEATTEK